jgi:hypothetical protein
LRLPPCSEQFLLSGGAWAACDFRAELREIIRHRGDFVMKVLARKLNPGVISR